MLAIHRSTRQSGFYRQATASMNKPAGMFAAADAFLTVSMGLIGSMGFPGCRDADLPDAEART